MAIVTLFFLMAIVTLIAAYCISNSSEYSWDLGHY